MKKKIVIGLVVTGIAAVAGTTIITNKLLNSTKPSSTISRNQKDFNPKTDSEQALRNQTSPSPSPSTAGATSPAPASLKPIITGVDGDSSAGATRFSVDALADSAKSGVCTLTVRQIGATITATSGISLVTSYYACGTMKLDKSKLSAGSATLTVSVDSPQGHGISDSRNITIVK